MKLTMSAYRDKILGAWMGKSAGGIIGAKQENNKNLLHYTFETVFPDVFPANDDFDLQVLWLFEVLEKKGLNFDSYDLAQAFAEKNKCWANEYRVAINNIERGLWPPLSGVYDNEYFHASMGCPIRSEVWALICPCDPEQAMRFAEMDGAVDHGEESVEGEKFLAALEAEAFFLSDIKLLIERALARLKPDTGLYGCIRTVLRKVGQNAPYEEIREELVKNYGSCDASYCVINIGFMMLALLMGNGDFEKTLLYAVNCGYDTDCTAATAGAIIGIVKGYDALPKEWRTRIGGTFTAATVDVDQRRNTYAEVADLTARVGLQCIRDGVNTQCVLEGGENIQTNIPSYRKRSALRVEYPVPPVIRANGECGLRVTVVPSRPNERGTLKLRLPPSLIAEKTEFAFELSEPRAVEVTFRVKENIKLLPEKNLVEFEYRTEGQKVMRRAGLIGAAKYKVYGPYFDQYDGKKYDFNIYGELMQRDERGALDIYAMFNGFADIDKEYLDETFRSLEKENYSLLYSGRHMLELEEHVGYKGPCCVYLVRDFIAEQEETVYLLIGNNAPYKVWCNGELIECCREHMHYMMQNRLAVLHLKRGENRLVYKVMRTDSFKFSAFLSKVEFGSGGVYVPISNKEDL